MPLAAGKSIDRKKKTRGTFTLKLSVRGNSYVRNSDSCGWYMKNYRNNTNWMKKLWDVSYSLERFVCLKCHLIDFMKRRPYYRYDWRQCWMKISIWGKRVRESKLKGQLRIYRHLLSERACEKKRTDGTAGKLRRAKAYICHLGYWKNTTDKNSTESRMEVEKLIPVKITGD